MHDEPRLLRSWPYELPHPVHGWVYHQLGSLAATGELVYEPNPAETARQLAQPWRYSQARMELEEVDRAAV
jgi:hypothetical protein